MTSCNIGDIIVCTNTKAFRYKAYELGRKHAKKPRPPKYLTKYKQYVVLDQNGSKVMVMDNKGRPRYYSMLRFSSLIELRQRKVTGIIRKSTDNEK